MNRNTLRLLGFAVALLLIALWLVESGDEHALPESGTVLLPDMKAVANDVDRVTISRAGEEPVVLVRESGKWQVPARDDYAADVTRISKVLLAMVDAKVVEAKTTNPQRFGRLGVDAPTAADSKGILVSASAGDANFALIFGNVAQRNYRYARIAGEDQAWLIDQNPDLPAAAGDWLEAGIIDIDATRVRSVEITHPDGQHISIGKAAEEDANFEVRDIPPGRELSYSTVANGIGGALNDLELDDVRVAVDDDDREVVTAVYETFDDLRIVARTIKADDGIWLSLSADALGDAPAKAEEIASKVAGWQYRIADYKGNLLRRRWEDILKEPASKEGPEPGSDPN